MYISTKPTRGCQLEIANKNVYRMLLLLLQRRRTIVNVLGNGFEITFVVINPSTNPQKLKLYRRIEVFKCANLRGYVERIFKMDSQII